LYQPPKHKTRFKCAKNRLRYRVAYTYDDAGRLSTVVDNRLSANNTTSYTYDAVGNVRQAVYPNSPNNAPSTCTYDTLNRLTACAA